MRRVSTRASRVAATARAAGIAAIAAGVAIVAAGTAAAAHAAFVGSDPADGAAVLAPPSVTLTFTEELLALGIDIAVTDEAGADRTAGDPDLSVARQVTVPVDATDPGAYTVRYRVVSIDGHVVEGAVHFTVVEDEASTTPSPSAAPTSTPTPSAPSPPPSGGDRPVGTSMNGEIYALVGVLLAGGVGLVIAGYFSRPKDSITGARRDGA